MKVKEEKKLLALMKRSTTAQPKNRKCRCKGENKQERGDWMKREWRR